MTNKSIKDAFQLMWEYVLAKVPVAKSTDQDKFLRGDGTWAKAGANSQRVILYANNWTTQADGTHAQSVSVNGVTTGNVNVVDCAQTATDKDANISILQGWGCVNDCKQSTGTLNYICYGDAPTVNIPLDVVVM